MTHLKHLVCGKYEDYERGCKEQVARIHPCFHYGLAPAKNLREGMPDREQQDGYQRDDEIILANRFFNNALISADVRPIVASSRLERNLPVDPIEAYVMSGYQEKIESHRLVHNE